MSKYFSQIYEFGPFRLDKGEGLLSRGSERVALTPKAFETLVALVERSGRLVEKDELMQLIWPDSFVEEANLTNNIWTLRKALGEVSSGQPFIETVPKRGYRFKADVRRLDPPLEAIAIERHTRAVVVTEEHETTLSVRSPTRNWSGRWVASLVALAVLIGAGVFVGVSRPWKTRQPEVKAAAMASAPKSIAILPMKSIGDQTQSEYLSLGLADALITKLGNVNQLVVRPTSAIRRYADVTADPVAVGRQQSVDAVLDGSFQRSGDRIRLTVQLIRVSDGSTIWSSQFDQRFTDILSVQDLISEQVACDLLTRLCGEAAASALQQKKINVAAYESYLRGRYFWNKRTMEGQQKAADSFRHAIDLEPTYARAYAGLGDAYYFLSNNDRAAGETYLRARASLQKALALDPSLSEPHATLGLMSMNNEWNWSEAEREFKQAIELSPNYATAHQWYGEFLAYMGKFDEAINELKIARELDPLSVIINTDLAKVHLLARRYDEANKLFESALDLDPNFDEAHALLGLNHSFSGRHAEAISEINKVQQLHSNPGYLSFLGHIYARAGERAKAQQVIEEMTRFAKVSYVSPYWWSIVYAGLDDKEQTFRQLEKIFDERAYGGAVSMKVNPMYDELRSDPRFARLLERAGF